MTRATREQVMVAMFAKVQTLPGYVTYSRHLKLFSDVPGDQQPYICMTEHNEGQNPRPVGMPVKLTLRASLVIYFRSDDQAGTTTMNNLLDAIDPIFYPDMPLTGKCTLGGLVDHAWIQGDVFKDPGDLDQQGMIVIPVFITLP